MAIKYGQIDSNVSLSFAFFVNAAMLIIAAAVFHFGKNKNENVADITTAYKLLEPALGDKVAPKLFAVALLCSGQQSTITGDFLHLLQMLEKTTGNWEPVGMVEPPLLFTALKTTTCTSQHVSAARIKH